MVRTKTADHRSSPLQGVRPQASLQRLLVLELSKGAAPSVTSLAERLGYGRPSVSRALSSLEGRALVTRSGRSRLLTDGGRAEAQMILTGVSRSAQLAMDRDRRVQAQFGRQIAREAGGIVNPPSHVGAAINRFAASDAALGAKMAAGGAIKQFAGLDAIGAKMAAGGAIKQFAGLDAIGAKMAAAGAINLFTGLDAVLDAQRLQASFLDAGALAGKWWSSAVGESMVVTSRMAADLAAIDPLLYARRSVVRALGAEISDTSGAVARAHAALTAVVLPSLDPDPPMDAGVALRSLLVPAVSAGAFVRGGRRLLEPIGRSDEVIIPSNVRDLAELIRVVNPDASEALLASWYRLYERGHDYHRGVAHHGREALRCLLSALAPDERLERPSKGSITRATRIRFVLAAASAHDADWASAQVDATLRLFDVLNSEAHVPRVPAQGLAGILESLTGTIRFLMSFVED